MLLAGVFQFINRKEYYTEDYKNFYVNKEKATTNEMEDLAVWINSPWSQAHMKYNIQLNCKNGYEEIPENVPTWKCEYFITGYDGIQAFIYGYGNTPEESLKNCNDFYDFLQKDYNKENIST